MDGKDVIQKASRAVICVLIKYSEAGAGASFTSIEFSVRFMAALCGLNQEHIDLTAHLYTCANNTQFE